MSFKGFSPGLICRGKQYAEHTLFEELDLIPCESGMHFCEDPFEVLSHYPLINGDGDLNEYALVQSRRKAINVDGAKYCTSSLYVDRRLTLREYVDEAFKFKTRDAPRRTWDRSSIATDHYASHVASKTPGARISAAASYSCIFASGQYDHLTVSGDNCSVLSVGDDVTIASSGDCSQIVTEGYGATISSSGRYVRIHTLSDSANVSINGVGAMVTANGSDTVIYLSGRGAVFRGIIGTVFIVYDGIVEIITVDGDTIKANTYYTFDGGKVVEWERTRNEE